MYVYIWKWEAKCEDINARLTKNCWRAYLGVQFKFSASTQTTIKKSINMYVCMYAYVFMYLTIYARFDRSRRANNKWI